ncbi:hypothetical protein SEA_SCHMIDT_64 [Gordonia phage Schmidt]|uniref:Uncharacterized protein n=1 Tax=Gordonia phage Schmidt TaxID=2301697 RepID=A0A385E0H9_9CAUD|nr:hypothetical protein KDJ59_gp64 [Gordonia phage Schmidt]AXQ65184.1 hypothetical protein SEA_SCHMIDT_64 [Gordonia phage Schmidt]
MTSTCAIKATDFQRTKSDPLWGEWTGGAMRHLIAALDGAKVLLTTDKQTGHTELVSLVGLRESTGGHWQVVTRMEFEDGQTRDTAHLLFKLGETIMVMPGEGRNAKWDALKSHMAEGSTAIAAVREMEPGQLNADGFYIDPKSGKACNWETMPTARGVLVKAYLPDYQTGRKDTVQFWTI